MFGAVVFFQEEREGNACCTMGSHGHGVACNLFLSQFFKPCFCCTIIIRLGLWFERREIEEEKKRYRKGKEKALGKAGRPKQAGIKTCGGI